MADLRRFAAALALVAALSGCGNDMVSGAVVGKRHEAAYDTTVSMCTARTSKGVCTAWTPVTTHHDEEWVLKLVDGKRAGTVHVDHDEWERYDVGGHYPDPR